MPTATFLSNATVNITQGATTTDLSDQCRSVTITIGSDPLESTAMGDTGHGGCNTFYLRELGDT